MEAQTPLVHHMREIGPCEYDRKGNLPKF